MLNNHDDSDLLVRVTLWRVISQYRWLSLTLLICWWRTLTILLSILLCSAHIAAHCASSSIIRRTLRIFYSTLIDLIVSITLSIEEVLMRAYSKSLRGLCLGCSSVLSIGTSFSWTWLQGGSGIGTSILLLVEFARSAITRSRHLIDYIDSILIRSGTNCSGTLKLSTLLVVGLSELVSLSSCALAFVVPVWDSSSCLLV